MVGKVYTEEEIAKIAQAYKATEDEVERQLKNAHLFEYKWAQKNNPIKPRSRKKRRKR